jgi:tetratricopeptide (TPR) repeat protein
MLKHTWRLPSGSAALIILVTVLAYFPTLRGGFVFDDYELIIRNPMVKADNGLQRFWFTTEASEYYPLTWSAWWLEWRLWGTSPLGYHVVNVLLHAASAVLVWLVLRHLKIPGAWLAAVVFAVHPVNVATVAWISEQKNTLSMFFYLLAILLYLRFDEENQWRWYRFSLAAFLLALLSKSAVVMLPVVLLGCLWWRRGRVQWKDLLHSASFFTLSLGQALVALWFHSHRGVEGFGSRSGFPLRLATAGRVPWFYLSKALLPLNLMVVYPKWHIDASQWASYAPGLLLVGMLGVFWWTRKTWGRPWLFGLGYFVVTLFPVLGFFDQSFYRYSSVADHWQYYSIIGVIALVVATGKGICEWIQWRYWRSGTLLGLAVAVVLAAATWRRGWIYHDNITLWRDNVARNPAPWPHNNLGCALQDRGEFDGAIQQFEQALRLDANYPEAESNLGNALLLAGKPEEAMRHWEQALQLKPDFPQVQYNLGLCLARQGKLSEAIVFWEQAVRGKPRYAEAHYNLGVALEQTGRIGEAIEHYQRAVECDPDYTLARNRLARLRTIQ